jgi:hypothetical protein
VRTRRSRTSGTRSRTTTVRAEIASAERDVREGPRRHDNYTRMRESAKRAAQAPLKLSNARGAAAIAIGRIGVLP